MIKIFDGLFISRNGDLFSARSKRVLKPTIGSGGYYEYSTKVDGRKKKLYQHRLVAIAFVPNPFGYKVVNHKDGNKLNNNPDNLEWCTDKQNSEHAWSTGLINNRGSKMTNARWLPSQVQLLRSLHKSGYTLTELCKANNCPESTMSLMLNRKTYQDVQ